MSEQRPHSPQGKIPMTKEDAKRIQAAGAKAPDSKTAQSGFDRRAQGAADRDTAKGGGGGKKP